MQISTLDWLKLIPLDYTKGSPMLLQYALTPDEMQSLAEHIDRLLEYKLNEAENERIQNMQQMSLF